MVVAKTIWFCSREKGTIKFQLETVPVVELGGVPQLSEARTLETNSLRDLGYLETLYKVL